MPLKTPRLSRCLVSLAKNPSTALSPPNMLVRGCSPIRSQLPAEITRGSDRRPPIRDGIATVSVPVDFAALKPNSSDTTLCLSAGAPGNSRKFRVNHKVDVLLVESFDDTAGRVSRVDHPSGEIAPWRSWNSLFAGKAAICAG
jgi:hypothetical protein